MFCSPGQRCDRMFEFHLPSPAAAGSSAAELWYCDLHHIPRATVLQLATLGQWRHHLTLLQHSYSWMAIQNFWIMWLYFSHIRCYLFLHTIFSIFFNFPMLDTTNSSLCPQQKQDVSSVCWLWLAPALSANITPYQPRQTQAKWGLFPPTLRWHQQKCGYNF